MVLNFIIGLFLYCGKIITSIYFAVTKIEKYNLSNKKILTAVILMAD